MYDRSRDFEISFNNENKNYFDSPRYELYAFFDPDCGRWCYELIDHNAFSLQDFNNEGGRLIKTSLKYKDNDFVEEILQKRYPDAMIAVYENIQTWLADRDAGCWQ